MTARRNTQFSVLCAEAAEKLFINVIEHPVILRSAFGTSHSSTTVRQNCVVQLQSISESGEVVTHGASEVGLPPKKIGVYEADYDDIVTFVSSVVEACISVSSIDAAGVAAAYRSIIPRIPDDFTSESAVWKLLAAGTSMQEPAYARAGLCGLELAALDFIATSARTSVAHLLTFETAANESPCLSFYTAALNDDEVKMVESARFGLAYTDCIKVKLAADVERGCRILNLLATSCKTQKSPGSSSPSSRSVVCSIDANSAWTPASALAALPAMVAAKEGMSPDRRPVPLLLVLLWVPLVQMV